MNESVVWAESLDLIDLDVATAIQAEEQRQYRKLILIASESLTPVAVRQALGSVFTSLYAEGYPSSRLRHLDESRLADLDEELAYYRRYGDRRYYKGTEYADVVEALAQRRVAHLFANERASVDDIYANVQPLSGSAANNAVYEALLTHGDTVMGMALNEGGHLTHGSPVNRSGKYFNIVSYGMNPATGRLDYDAIERLALEHKPRMIIGGTTAYPWDIDWARLRQIADAVPGRAYLLADISHPAGLVVTGLFPNPVGYADVVTFTTHKTLLGPRAAAILTTDKDLADRIDRAVFPGEQGGPHLNQIAAMAVAFRFAKTAAFLQTMQGVVDNAKALAAGLRNRGLTLIGGGTNTHLLLIDLNQINTPSGLPLKGDIASRILDTCGIVANRNTIPGDTIAAQASGIRLGTVWLTQRGFGPTEMDKLAALIHRALTSVHSFRFPGKPNLGRGKVEAAVLHEVRRGVTDLVEHASFPPAAVAPTRPAPTDGWALLEVIGERADEFVEESCVTQVFSLAPGESRSTAFLDAQGQVVAPAEIIAVDPDRFGRRRYLLALPSDQADVLAQWLQDLSDGYLLFDSQRVEAKIDGPVALRWLDVSQVPGLVLPAQPAGSVALDAVVDVSKPYFVGQDSWHGKSDPKPDYSPVGYSGPDRRSALYDEHLKLTTPKNLVPFGGWTMPISYGSIAEEYRAVRQSAALFDVTHMGVLEVAGPGAARFLDLVASNSIAELAPGKAQYSYLLDPEGTVIDDIFIYCRAKDRFMLVVNAANAERDEDWLRAVNERRCLIDRQRPWKEVDATPTIRNLKDESSGAERRVDIALQGPLSLAILQEIAGPDLARVLGALGKSEFVEGHIGGIDALISRTGYTGEEWGFELYVHPDAAPRIWQRLLEVGGPKGLKPAGLGARDAARIEAGFPLWGHELAGQYSISPMGAGYATFVKAHKPFFIGRDPLLAAEAQRTRQVVRFATDTRGLRAIRTGDPVASARGQVIGYVTSATVIESRQIGLAYVDRRYTKVGTPLNVLPVPRGGRPPTLKPLAELTLGDEVPLPELAKVVPHFGLKLETGLA